MPDSFEASRARLLFSEVLLTISLGFLVGYTAWARGGTVVAFQNALLPLTLPVIFLTLLGPLCDGAGWSGGLLRRWKGLALDPVAWLLLLLLALLLVQWLNAGRERMFDFVTGSWRYGPPADSTLPGAIKRSDALEMLRWFVPATAVVLAIRHGLASRRAIRLLMAGLMLNAALLCCVGVAQFLTKTDSIYWMLPPLTVHFFAGFGYQNHGAAFAFLNLCIALAFVVRTLARGQETGCRELAFVWGVVLVVLFTLSAHLALSRGIAVLTWIALAFGLQAMWGVLARRLSPLAQLNGRLILAVSVLGACCLVLYAGGERFDNELETLSPQSIQAGLTVRAWQIDAAWTMWNDHPLCGVGGWGYKHMIGLYTPQELWPLILNMGKANVHNDAVQFLTEFGLLGFLCMTLAVLWMLRNGLRRWQSPWVRFLIIGMLGVMLYSNVDLPFRCPAILLLWSSVLAGVSVYDGLPEHAAARIAR